MRPFSRRSRSGASGTDAHSGQRDVDAEHDRDVVRLEVVEIGTFEAFYQSEYGPMLGLAYQLTGRRDVAEDLVQEAMTRAYRNWGRISSYERPGAWLRRALLNLAASNWRRHRTAARSLVRLAPVPNHPEPTAETIEVWATVRRLPRRQAETVALYYGCDLSVDEIAEVLDCAAGTVRAHLHRARESLATMFPTEEPS